MLILYYLTHRAARAVPPPYFTATHRQNSLTGHITYGNSNSYVPPQQPPHNPALARQGFKEDRPAKNKKQSAAPAAAAPVAVGAPVFVAPPPGAGAYIHGPAPFTNSPVPFAAATAAPFGTSPVPMYPAAPWAGNVAVAPVSPVPFYTPEQARKRQEDARKKMEEKKKKAREGTWERFYTEDGRTFWQHTGTGKRVNRDPYD